MHLHYGLMFKSVSLKHLIFNSKKVFCTTGSSVGARGAAWTPAQGGSWLLLTVNYWDVGWLRTSSFLLEPRAAAPHPGLIHLQWHCVAQAGVSPVIPIFPVAPCLHPGSPKAMQCLNTEEERRDSHLAVIPWETSKGAELMTKPQSLL